MKPGHPTLRLLFLAAAPFLASNCSSPRSEPQAGATVYLTDPAPPAKVQPLKAAPPAPVQAVKEKAPAHKHVAESAPAPAPKVKQTKHGKTTASSAAGTDVLDDYETTAASQVSDPLEGLNRGIFRFNDGVYDFILRPISKGYEVIAIKPIRQGLDNFFENVKFPVRFVNCGLQGKFKRAGLESEKFVVNTIGGVGGFFKPSDKIPSLVDVPAEDTGLTFAHWGIGHGPYLVLPIFGSSSIRDGVGLVGDYALNPVNWGTFMKGKHSRRWTWIPPTVNTVRLLPSQLEKYDNARANSVDPYLAVRSAYLQNRAAAAKQ